MAGQFRNIVGVFKLADEPVRDALGGLVDSDHEKLFDWRCDVIVISGASAIRQGLEANSELISMKGWNDGRVKHDHLVEYNGAKYEISSIKPTGRRDLKVIITARREI